MAAVQVHPSFPGLELGQFMVTFNPQMSPKHSEVATSGVGAPANEAAAAARPASASSVSGNLDLPRGGAALIAAGTGRGRLSQVGSSRGSSTGGSRNSTGAGNSTGSAAPPPPMPSAEDDGDDYGDPTPFPAASSPQNPSPSPGSKPSPGSGCTAASCGFVLSPDGKKVKPQGFPAGQTFYVQLKGRDEFSNLMYQKPQGNQPPENIRATLCYVLQLAGMTPGESHARLHMR